MANTILNWSFFADQMEVADVKDAMALVYEYGQKEQFESAVVKERGKCLMEHAALELARYHLNNYWSNRTGYLFYFFALNLVVFAYFSSKGGF